MSDSGDPQAVHQAGTSPETKAADPQIPPKENGSSAITLIQRLRGRIALIGSLITVIASVGMVLKGLIGYSDFFHFAFQVAKPGAAIESTVSPTAPNSPAARTSIVVLPF